MRHQKSHSKSRFCHFFLFLFIWLGLGVSHLLATPTFPHLSGRVVDTAGVLESVTKDSLEALLAEHESKTTNQVVVVVLNTLDGYEIADYGYQLGRFWNIGQKDKNNGVILIVALQDHRVRIEVGYGLEGILTDAKTKTIIEQSIIPHFKQGNTNKGLEEGVKGILEILEGSDAVTASSEEAIYGLALLIFFVIFVAFCLTADNSNKNDPGSRGGGFFGSGRSSGGGFSGGGGSFGGGGSIGKW